MLDDYPVVITVPVAWGEQDAFQHVNNAVYFRYFESARMAYFEESGIYTGGMPQGVGPILASTSCRFKLPLTYPDTLSVGVRVQDVGLDRFTMEYALVSAKHQRIAAVGEGLVVSFDYANGCKAALPEEWKRSIQRLAANTRQPVGGKTSG